MGTNSNLYATGTITSEGIYLQKKVQSEKEVLSKGIYTSKDQVIYKLVEVKIKSELVEK